MIFSSFLRSRRTHRKMFGESEGGTQSRKAHVTSVHALFYSGKEKKGGEVDFHVSMGTRIGRTMAIVSDSAREREREKNFLFFLGFSLASCVTLPRRQRMGAICSLYSLSTLSLHERQGRSHRFFLFFFFENRTALCLFITSIPALLCFTLRKQWQKRIRMTRT